MGGSGVYCFSHVSQTCCWIIWVTCWKLFLCCHGRIMHMCALQKKKLHLSICHLPMIISSALMFSLEVLSLTLEKHSFRFRLYTFVWRRQVAMIWWNCWFGIAQTKVVKQFSSIQLLRAFRFGSRIHDSLRFIAVHCGSLWSMQFITIHSVQFIPVRFMRFSVIPRPSC